MAVIEVEHLTRTFGTTRAVDDVSFSVEEGQILVIVGASGCGKTTTLRCIAGLDRPTAGRILLDGQVVASERVFVPPERRGIGMVFQSYALWPHKSVYDNVAYSLVVRRRPSAEIREAVAAALDLVGLAGMGDRFPATLSGGQQQRVALARCAVARPRVLLLDEPLSNLDAKLREQMRGDLKRLIKSLSSTAIHITHDQTEAMALADQVICMRAGRIAQAGSGRELYRTPNSRFVADFIGGANFLEGTIANRDPAAAIVRLAGGIELVVAHARSATSPDGSNEVTVLVRPEQIELATSRPDGANAYEVAVLEESFLGEYTEYVVGLGPSRLRVRSQIDLPTGATAFVRIAPDKLVCLPRDGTKST